MSTILQAIEEKRQSIYDLAGKYGISDLRVLQKSQELDVLLNQYQREKNTK